MKKYGSDHLIRLFIYLSIAGFVIISAALILIFTKKSLDNYDKSLDEIKIAQYKKARLEAKDRVDKLVDFIHINESLLYRTEKEKVKNSVRLGIEIVKNVYEQFQWFPKEIIYEKIRDKLRNIRFFENKSGYFFMYDLKGTCLLLPAKPSLEDKNLIDLKDAKGNYPVRESIELVKQKGEGFLSWYWHKIGEDKMKEKVGYVKLYKPLGIFLGTARYSEDIIANIEKELRHYLKSLDKDSYGYIFAYDYMGNMKKEGESYSSINRWDEKINGHHFIREAIIGAQTNPDGFFISHVADNEKEVVSYIRAIPKLKWIIGTNVTNEDNLYNQQKELLDKEIFKTISDTIILSLIVLAFMIVGYVIIGLRIKKRFYMLEHSLIVKNKELSFQATHDSLTKLPNRILLLDRISHSIDKAKRDGKMLAILFLDIDNFKMVNDAYGHDAGDRLLLSVAKILNSKVRKSDTVARFGGDEFVILLDDLTKIEDCIVITKKIVESFNSPVLLESFNMNISFSIGVAIFPNDAKDSETLLRYADIAMYKAKSDGKNRYVFYDESMNKKIIEHMKIEKELKNGIRNDEFIIHYQPQVDINTKEIVGFEALVRWQHPTRGITYPDYFIQVAEESDLIVEIGNLVLKKAMNQMREWYDKGLNPGIVSINFATRQLEMTNLFEYFEANLKNSNCKSEWIEVEVIERFLMKDISRSVGMLKRFRELGLGVAIDDFGTGYSSLSYLKYLPVTKLKIDKSFIDGIVENKSDRAIAKSIIDLAIGLGLDVLAEGVENQEQFEILKNMGCHTIQGYYFYQPMPAYRIEEILKDRMCYNHKKN